MSQLYHPEISPREAYLPSNFFPFTITSADCFVVSTSGHRHSLVFGLYGHVEKGALGSALTADQAVPTPVGKYPCTPYLGYVGSCTSSLEFCVSPSPVVVWELFNCPID